MGSSTLLIICLDRLTEIAMSSIEEELRDWGGEFSTIYFEYYGDIGEATLENFCVRMASYDMFGILSKDVNNLCEYNSRVRTTIRVSDTLSLKIAARWYLASDLKSIFDQENSLIFSEIGT